MFAARIARGCKVLNKIKPGWTREIDLDDLDMGNCGRCVLGQLFGDFSEGAYRVYELGYKPTQSGFTLKYIPEEARAGYARLTKEWKSKIRELRRRRKEKKNGPATRL